ncbi:hypothetical protein [Nioella nitratireducens]|uniref:hypothetical protein n=1 Tax=Nioella nitratireducens TaxID=1287720 RepID=UPI0011BAAE9D|nr:hypothetical protein [Nioella nitratireducens]
MRDVVIIGTHPDSRHALRAAGQRPTAPSDGCFGDVRTTLQWRMRRRDEVLTTAVAAPTRGRALPGEFAPVEVLQ